MITVGLIVGRKNVGIIYFTLFRQNDHSWVDRREKESRYYLIHHYICVRPPKNNKILHNEFFTLQSATLRQMIQFIIISPRIDLSPIFRLEEIIYFIIKSPLIG